MPESQYLPTYKGCFVCGHPDVNPNTLNRRFKVTSDGVEVFFKADYRQAGYKDIVHGGVITALLDETMGWSVAVERKKLFVTGEITVRFVRPLPTELEVKVTGRTVENKSRYSVANGEITDAKDTVYAKATGKFFLMKDFNASEINSYLTYAKNDLNIFADE